MHAAALVLGGLAGETWCVNFVHESLPQRVLFLTGDAAGGVKTEVERIGAERGGQRELMRAGLADEVLSLAHAPVRNSVVAVHPRGDLQARQLGTNAGHDVANLVDDDAFDVTMYGDRGGPTDEQVMVIGAGIALVLLILLVLAAYLLWNRRRARRAIS